MILNNKHKEICIEDGDFTDIMVIVRKMLKKSKVSKKVYITTTDIVEVVITPCFPLHRIRYVEALYGLKVTYNVT